MFKKGQLVRSTINHLYVVVDNGEPLVKVRSVTHGFYFEIRRERLRLLGNNYRAKQK